MTEILEYCSFCHSMWFNLNHTILYATLYRMHAEVHSILLASMWDTPGPA